MKFPKISIFSKIFELISSKKKIFIIAGLSLSLLFILVLMVIFLGKREEKIKSYTENIKKNAVENVDSTKSNLNVDTLINLDITKSDDNSLSNGCECCIKLFDFYFKKALYFDALNYFDKINISRLDFLQQDSLFLKKAIAQSNLQMYSDAVVSLNNIKSLNVDFYRYLIKGKMFASLGQRDSLVVLVKDYARDFINAKSSYEQLLGYTILLFRSGASLYKVKDLLNKLKIKTDTQRDYRLYKLEGEILHKQKKYRSSISLLKKGLEYYPFNVELRNVLAMSYYYLHEYNNALENLNISISVSNNDYYTFFNRAKVYLAMNRDSLAFEDFKRAYSLNPNYYYSLIEMAQIYEKIGKLNKAILVSEKALKVLRSLKKQLFNSNDKKFILYLSKLYIKKGTELYYKKADTLVVEICKQEPTNIEALKLYEKLNGRIFRLSNYNK